MPLDPRLHAFRPDLADERLRGRLEAERFVAGTPASVRVGCADLKRLPAVDAPNDSQLLYGEPLLVFERRDGFAWVQNESDGYVGWLREQALGQPQPVPTHRLGVLRTPLLPEPLVRAPYRDILSFGSKLAVTGWRDRYAELAGGGWVFADHLVELDRLEPDFTATACRFLGLPYLWGGRSVSGLDCSALVQLSLAVAGIALPRDSDQQEQAPSAGQRLPPDSSRRRGDLLFWRGHVAIALDAERVVNATGGPMLVVEEPFAALDARARAEYSSGLRSLRRL
ncbi:MAG TPA: NlpC/P60 family protein [Kiloniellales bacterium]|nr:NlpC/P60 family protein [Kiloniellales bacterium]